MALPAESADPVNPLSSLLFEPATSVDEPFINPWDFFVTHRRMIGKASENCCIAHQVFGNKPIVHVHVRMPCRGEVLKVVLQELKSWEADRIERVTIGAPGVNWNKVGQPEIVERLHPFGEDWHNQGVAFEEDSAEATVPVSIEID